MIVRLNGDFDSRTQPALHEGFGWITGPVTIDVASAWLSATALGEIACLAKRIGMQNVTLSNPGPILRRVLTISRLDRIIRVT